MFISKRKITPGVPPNVLSTAEKIFKFKCTEKNEPTKFTAKKAHIPCNAVKKTPLII